MAIDTSYKRGALLERRCGVRAEMDDNMVNKLHFGAAEGKFFVKNL